MKCYHQDNPVMELCYTCEENNYTEACLYRVNPEDVKQEPGEVNEKWITTDERVQQSLV